MHPAHEARMGVAGNVGLDGFGEGLIQGGGVSACCRQGFFKAIAHWFGHLLPDGDVAQAGEMIDHVVHHFVAEGAEV